MQSTVEIDKKIFDPEGWEFTAPKDRMFTSDHMIDAYLSGHQNALEKEKKLVLTQLASNIQGSSDNTKKLREYLESVNIQLIQTYLKVETWNSFSLLLIIPEKDYLKPEIFEVYKYIENFEDSVNSEFYQLSISLCDVDEEGINDGRLKSDGYSFRFKL